MRCEERYNTRLNCIINQNIRSVCGMIIGVNKTSNCLEKKPVNKDFDNNFTEFNGRSEDEKYGVYYPPRRKEICLDVVNNLFTSDTASCLIDAFASVAKKEGELLWDKYEDKKKAMTAIRRSYADLSDIIKGTDLWIDEDPAKTANEKIKNVFYLEGEKKSDGMTRKQWWDKYRNVIWKGMLCGIQNEVKEKFPNEQLCFFHKDFDEIPQSLRCFVEWTEDFLEEKSKQINTFENSCKSIYKNTECQNLEPCEETFEEPCEKPCESYKKWIDSRRKQYVLQEKKYDIDQKNKRYVSVSDAQNANANEYLRKRCPHCNINDIEKVFGYPEGYENICKCLIEPNIEEMDPNESKESTVEETENEKKSRESSIQADELSPKTTRIDGGNDDHSGVTDVSDKKNDLLNVNVPTFLTALGGIILLVTLLYRVRYEHIRSSN